MSLSYRAVIRKASLDPQDLESRLFPNSRLRRMVMSIARSLRNAVAHRHRLTGWDLRDYIQLIPLALLLTIGKLL